MPFAFSACAGRPIANAFNAPNSDLGVAATALQPAKSSALRAIFSAPNSNGSTYAAQTFDVYQIPTDTYQNPDAIEITPQGQTPPPTSAGSTPAPLPYGIIVYPDGSTQTADANGAFTPANSSYAQNNATTIEANPGDGIDITVQDPSGQAQPISAQVQAGTTVSPDRGGIGHQSAAAVARAAAAGASLPFASIVLLPRSLEVAGGTPVAMSAFGLDSDGHAIALNGESVTWSRPSAGSISTLAAGAAIYVPPANRSGTEPLTATIDAGSGRRYLASAAIIYDGPDTLAPVRGTLAQQSGRQAGLAFLGVAQTPFAPRPLWFARANSTSASAGAFTARLPVGMPLVPFAISGSAGPGSLATLAPGGGSSFVVSPNGAANALGTFSVESVAFSAPARAVLPPVSTAIRDANVLARFLQIPDVYATDSGLAPLLAAPFSPARGTVTSGSFAGWAFEWASQGGSPTLTLIEMTNGSAGTRSVSIAPLGDGTTYQFTRYRAPAASSSGYPLTAAQSGSIIEESGAWSQPGGTGPSALAIALYDFAHAAPASPAYSLRGTYASASGGTPAAFSSATIYDAAGSSLWTFSATRSGNTTDASYRLDAKLVRSTPTSAGPYTENYLLTGRPDGNGGATMGLANLGHAWNVTFDSTHDLAMRDGLLTLGSQNVARFHTDRAGQVRAELYDARDDGLPLEFPL